MSSDSQIFAFEMNVNDAAYYLETVIFKVESTLFKVPRYQFQLHSGKFATMLAPVKDQEPVGSSRESPIRLDGIKCVDFRRLLRVLYPFSEVPKTPLLTKEEWISVLRLANIWRFLEIRKLAVDQLSQHAESLECIERILLARECDVSAWLRSGYTELARRKVGLSTEEAQKIGLEAAMQIYQLREGMVSSDKNPYETVQLGTAFQAEFRNADAIIAPAPLAIAAAASTPPLVEAPPPTLRNNQNPLTLDINEGFSFKADTSAFHNPSSDKPITFKTHNSDAPVASASSTNSPTQSGSASTVAGPMSSSSISSKSKTSGSRSATNGKRGQDAQ